MGFQYLVAPTNHCHPLGHDAQGGIAMFRLQHATVTSVSSVMSRRVEIAGQWCSVDCWLLHRERGERDAVLMISFERERVCVPCGIWCFINCVHTYILGSLWRVSVVTNLQLRHLGGGKSRQDFPLSQKQVRYLLYGTFLVRSQSDLAPLPSETIC